MEGSQNHSVYIETSQIILDTLSRSVYDNKLFVRGRAGGEFSCFIRNSFQGILPNNRITITGNKLIINIHLTDVCFILVPREPGKLDAVIYSSTNTHVNITVSWESPTDTVTTGYVIYYQPKTGGPVISESVTGGHRDSHSLTGLQRGHTYNISIVALSQHLPSPLVGPVNVATGEIQAFFLNYLYSNKFCYWWLRPHLGHSPNEPFSLTCTVRGELGGYPTIKWIHVCSVRDSPRS